MSNSVPVDPFGRSVIRSQADLPCPLVIPVVAVCHSRVPSSGIHSQTKWIPAQKHAGMTEEFPPLSDPSPGRTQAWKTPRGRGLEQILGLSATA